MFNDYQFHAMAFSTYQWYVIAESEPPANVNAAQSASQFGFGFGI